MCGMSTTVYVDSTDVHVASAALECGRVNCEETRVTVRHLQEICDADHKCAIYEAK